MAEISREEAIETLRDAVCIGIVEKGKNKAISDMEKLVRIEKLFEPHEFGTFPYSYEDIGKAVGQIVKGE